MSLSTADRLALPAALLKNGMLVYDLTLSSFYQYLNSAWHEVSFQSSTSWSDITDKPFNTVDTNTLKIVNNTLSVNTTDDAEDDNTRPITSSGVYTIVGNIEILLGRI